MAYATYTTQALVCGSRDSYTSDRSYLLFTQEAGMLWATARSVREEKSKQRFALQDFSFIRVSLVKGRSGWRIGSVEAVSNPFMEARSRSERAYVKNIVTLIRRYVHGEQPIPLAFGDTKEALAMSASQTELDIMHQLFTVRLLSELGYLAQPKDMVRIFETKSLTEAVTFYQPQQASELTKLIEQAHNLSHL